MGRARSGSPSRLASPLSALFMGVAPGGGCPNLMFLPNCRWRETQDRRAEAVKQLAGTAARVPACPVGLRHALRRAALQTLRQTARQPYSKRVRLQPRFPSSPALQPRALCTQPPSFMEMSLSQGAESPVSGPKVGIRVRTKHF